MCDIKSVISLLCKHLSASADVTFKPEYFRLAKYDAVDENLNRTFWTALNVLSMHVVREQGGNVNFSQLGIILQVKLQFAFLNYNRLEFYNLIENGSGNRELLLAFAWLLATHKALDKAVHFKLAGSVLGRECSDSDIPSDELPSSDPKWSLANQINDILNLNGKVNNGIKEIYELVTEKAKLLAKIHAATLNVSGLPHLNVSEIALIKHCTTRSKETCSRENENKLHELRTMGFMLDIHTKWIKKEHAFFDWMVTVLQEENKKPCPVPDTENWHEVSKFVSLLRHVVKEKLSTNDPASAEVECWSRFVRTQNGNENLDNWLAHTTGILNEREKELQTKKEQLSAELKIILESIPHCVRV